jgi:hypothetical protein
MNGHIGAAVENGGLDLFDEHPLSTESVKRHIGATITEGLDKGEFHLEIRMTMHQFRGHDLALGPRLRARPSGETESVHGRPRQSRSKRSRTAAA